MIQCFCSDSIGSPTTLRLSRSNYQHHEGARFHSYWTGSFAFILKRLARRGIFNVINKSGGAEFHGEGIFYGNPQKFVRETKNFPFTGEAPNEFPELDAGFDLGGPIKEDPRI
jgi:hypothetical protein